MADGTEPRLIRIPGPLAGGAGWGEAALPDPAYRPALAGDKAGLRLAADPAGPLRLDSRDGSLGRLTLPRGLAVDADLRVYLLDAERGWLLRNDPSARGYDPGKPFVALPAVGNHPASGTGGDNPRRLVRANAIATDRDSLYVVDVGSGRVLVFALNSWGLRDVWTLPGADRPWDVTAVGGRVFVLSPDRVYRWRPGELRPRPLIARPNGPLWYWSRLAADKGGKLYVLTRRRDGSSPRLLVYDPERPRESIETVEEAAAVRDRFPVPAVYSLPDESGASPQFVLPEPLTRACGREWPAPPAGQTVEAYLSRGPGPGGFVFDEHGDRVKPENVRPPRSRLFRTGANPKADPPWISRPLDSKVFDCRWHAVELLFADLPPGCTAEVRTYTAREEIGPNEIANLPDEAWAAGLAVTGPPRAPAADPRVRTDFLVGSPPGQFLWLRVRFRGDGFATPVLRSAEVRFPRLSYLEHLPAVFSEDEAGRRFLERFLAVFQAEWDRLEDRADGLAGLFDPEAVPDSHLDYLAGWLGARFENGWPRDARRQLLRRLPGVFFAARRPDDDRPGGTRRGTPAALRDYVAAVLAAVAGADPGPDGFPFVIEGFRDRDYRLLPGVLPGSARGEAVGPARPLWGPSQVGRFQLGVASRLGEERLLPPGPPDRDVFAAHAHRFRVVVPAAWVPTPAAEGAVRRAIEAEKPAHTRYELQLVRPGLRVGVQSTVGVDTILGGAGPRLTPAGPRLGADAALAAPAAGPTPARLDAGVRLGTDHPRI